MDRGYTLLELLIVLAVMGIITAFSVVVAHNANQRNDEQMTDYEKFRQEVFGNDNDSKKKTIDIDFIYEKRSRDYFEEIADKIEKEVKLILLKK